MKIKRLHFKAGSEAWGPESNGYVRVLDAARYFFVQEDNPVLGPGYVAFLRDPKMDQKKLRVFFPASSVSSVELDLTSDEEDRLVGGARRGSARDAGGDEKAQAERG